jgi:hypothetical protein
MKNLGSLSVLFGFALIAACGTGAPNGGNGENGENGGTPETSLSGDVMPLIQAQCGGCHTRTDAPFPDAVVNDVYLEIEDDLLGMVGTFITAGDAANSGFIAILKQEMEVGQGPTAMPPPGMAEAMSDDDVAVVSAWIDEGAKDN